MSDGQKRDLLALFLDISQGYTEYSIDKKSFFFKHFSKKDHSNFCNFYKSKLDECIDEGVLSEKAQIDVAYKNGWWTAQKESQISAIKNSLNRLLITKSKLIYESDKKRIQEQISGLEKDLDGLENEKKSYISLTAEEIATKKLTSFFVQSFIYNDRELKQLSFPTTEAFDAAEDDTIDILSLYYYKFISDYSDIQIKRVAIDYNFQNMLYVANGATDIFGKAIIFLTKYQLDLLVWGQYYQNIIKNSSEPIPEKIYENPDQLPEWFAQISNSNSTKSKLSKQTADNSSGSTFLFGDRDDIKALSGGEISGDKIVQESKEKGGLGLYDLLDK